MLTWTNKAFQVCTDEGGIKAHMVDARGVIIFRWRLHYDEETYEEFTVPFDVIEEFETFKALCRQFKTPGDAEAWYLKRINRNGRK